MNKRKLVQKEIPLTPVVKSISKIKAMAPKKKTVKMGGSISGGSITLPKSSKYGAFAGATLSPDTSKMQGQGIGDTIKKYARKAKDWIVQKVKENKVVSKAIRSLSIPADAAFGPYAGIVVNAAAGYVEDKFGVGMISKGLIPK